MSSKSAYPWFFFYRITRLCLLVFLPTLFLILFLYRSSYKEGLVSQLSLQAAEDLRLVVHSIESSGRSPRQWCEGLPALANVRYTLSDPGGLILCDSVRAKAGQRLAEEPEAIQSSVVVQGLVLRKIVPAASFKKNMKRFDRVLFKRIVPFSFLSYLVFIYLFYLSTKPLGLILSKVQKFREDIPFNRSLELLYQKDEWAQIEEALNKADQRLQAQVEQVKTENEKIAAILESIHDDIIAIDRYETVLFYNSNFRKHFMRERSQKQITPRIWHTFSDETILAGFRSVLQDGKEVSLKSVNFPESRFPEKFFDLTITPLRSPAGGISGALGVFYDVTEVRLTEQMRVDFVANVSHEIRTPLTSVKGFTQLLQDQGSKIDPSLHMFLEKIVSNTERMISLFNDLLSLSVIESRNLIRFEELSLPEIVETVTESILANYPAKKIRFEQDLRLATIKGDHRLMEQVLSNLVDNACKYGGPELSIKISSFRKDGKAYLMVSDTGPGISKEHIQRIFERFYRVEASRESSRGTGLGLSIVKHIIAKHGGRIWAESEERSGSNFIIELPLE